MKTVGEILKNARQEKKLTLEGVEQATKIRKKYLLALEENTFEKLPSLTYVQGFIKNYAEFLGQDTSYILSVFRRQFDSLEKPKVIPPGLSEPLNEPFWRLTPSKIIGIFILILVFLFFFWLFSQYQSFVWAPKINLESPSENEIIKGEKVQVLGRTDPWATLTINGQEVKLLDGRFSQEIAVSPGIVTINISATNKFAKKQELKRTIRVESP
ncbi:helix-turn-helix domain-containing protein [Candidatus Gottesmanbacteria bacterium]|nr:helix-turn-helix domain-containing protein [Candidatus Gottesmanbacteria bacterium]